jgi:tyrosine-protein phosphatase SIW14
MPRRCAWLGAACLLAGVIAAPAIYYRIDYAQAKRLREVTPGRFYRCGQLNGEGLRQAIRQHGIRTVINLQHEAPDPLLDPSYWQSQPKKTESAICHEEGATYELMTFDPFPREHAPEARPTVIDSFLKILDDPTRYPVLIHCKAGLHRTGELTAVYRMEYEGWSPRAAIREMKANGFGEYACTQADDFVHVFIEKYRPGVRLTKPQAAVTGAAR